MSKNIRHDDISDDEKDIILGNMFRELPGEVEPPAFLWDKIEDSIDKIEEANNIDEHIEEDEVGEIKVDFFTFVLAKSRYFGAAAAALVMIVVGIGLFTRFYTPAGSDAMTAQNEQYEEALGQLEEAALQYNQAREKLLAILDENDGMLSDETVVTIKANVTVIEDAVNDIKIALQQDPNNEQILVQLATIYYEETNLLTKTTDLLEGVSN